MRLLCSTKGMTREDWLEVRRQGIGGSDASAVCGMNPWVSPTQVWLEKTGRVDGPDLSENESVYWGTQLENVVAQEFAKRTGAWVQRHQAVIVHPVNPWMIGTVDRLIRPQRGSGEWGVLECKTSNAFSADQWADDEIPEHYVVQLQHYLAITGFTYGYVAVLVGGNRYRHWQIHRDQELIDYLIEIERRFWFENVMADAPPPVDGSEASAQVLDRLYPPSSSIPETVPLPASAEDLIQEYRAAVSLEKAHRRAKHEAANQLKALLGDAENGTVGPHRVSWRPVKRSNFDVKRLNAEYPEIYALFANTSTHRRFAVRTVEDGDY